VIGDESEGGDCDEVICAGWGEPGGEWTEWGWRNVGLLRQRVLLVTSILFNLVFIYYLYLLVINTKVHITL